MRRLVESGLTDARRILTDRVQDLEAMAQGLLEYETLTGDEIKNLIQGRPPVRDANEPPTPSRGSPVPLAGRNRPRGEPEGGLEPQPQA